MFSSFLHAAVQAVDTITEFIFNFIKHFMDSTPISVSKLRTQIMLQIDYYFHRCLYVLPGVSQNICLRYCQHFLAINDALEADQRLLCLYLNLLSIPSISLLKKLMLVKINNFCGTRI